MLGIVGVLGRVGIQANKQALPWRRTYQKSYRVQKVYIVFISSFFLLPFFFCSFRVV